MKAWKMNVRLVALVAAVCCCTATKVQAQGTTVTVSPGNLSFGVPGVTSGVPSAPESVVVSIGGTGTATVSFMLSATSVNNVSIGSQDFTETDTCGTNPHGSNMIGAPGCTISVTFTPSQVAGILESATLTVMVTGNDAFHIPLTGALGAIRLFDPVNVAKSRTDVVFPFAFGSTTQNLSCPANPPAKISSSPDGNGNVVVDNFLTLAVGSTPMSTAPFGPGSPAGNVCMGGVTDSSGNTTQQDCFTQTYRDAAGNFGADGDDPDNFANGSPGTAWGVAPIDVTNAFANDSAATPTAIFSLLDGGVVYTSTTLYLVTSCSVTNANTGTETGNPLNQQPSQTLSFDTVLNHLDQYAFDYSLAPAGSIKNQDSTPIVTNNSISTGDFKNLVLGTPFQNTSCIPLASLNGNCALKTQVCVPSTGGAATGAQCPQSTTTPPTPDFLFTSTFDPPTPISDPTSIFGFLEFNDAGTCTGGLEGPEANNSCPQNGLVSFTGPGENAGRRGAGSVNSSAIMVTGVNPPTTTVVVSPSFPAGPSAVWTNGNPQVTFTGNPGASTPVVAPVNFIEYGVTPPTQGLPPTFPIPFTGNGTFAGDQILGNTACPQGSNPYTATAPAFMPGPVSISSLGNFTDGQSNLLHFSTTDCAATHELLFTLSGVGGSWSTSFKSLTLKTDTAAPMISVTTPASGGSYSANQKVAASYGCSDSESGVATCAGTVPNGSNIDTTPNGLITPKTFTVTTTDNVGNSSTSPLIQYSVTCNYAAVTLNPSSVTRPALIGITASVADCMSAPQSVKVQFSLSGPLGKNCSNSSTVLFTTPTFTIKSGTSSSITFPFLIAKNACAGTYTVTTATLQGPNNTAIDTVISTLMVH